MGEQRPTTTHAIEIRIEYISQLSQSFDPFPFRERDLDKDAEEFIVSWARELPTDQPLRIIVHLPEAQASMPEARELSVAITRYFGYRARVIALELNEQFRVGRRALVIGVTSAFLFDHHGTNSVSRPCAASGRSRDRRELAYFWLGRQLEADRNTSL